MNAHLSEFAVNLEMWWPNLSPLDRVEAAVAAGFSKAEIWFWPNWHIEELGHRATAMGLDIVQLGGWDFEPRLHEVPHAFREGMQRAIEVASGLRTPRININGPYLHPGEDPAAIREGVTRAVEGVVDLFEDSELTLMVEPMNREVDHPDYSMPLSADVIDICMSIGSPRLGINWDLYHLEISEGDLATHLEAGADHIAYVQVADHPGRHEPGTGRIDYGSVLAKVRSVGYSGPIGLECSPLEDEKAAIARILDLAPEETP